MWKFVQEFVKDANKNRLLLLRGEIGMGKTLVTKRILEEMQKKLGNKPDFPLILAASINPLDQIYPLSGVRHIFR